SVDTSENVHRHTAHDYQPPQASIPPHIPVTAAMAEPRYASLKGIMAARSKEIKQLAVADLGVEKSQAAETIEGVTDAETRKAGEVIEDDGTAVDKIVQVLSEAKVL